MISLLQKQGVMIWLMAAVVFFLTLIIKLPIKHFTNKIGDDKFIVVFKKKILVRKLVNSVILLIPFGLGVLTQYIYSICVPDIMFNVITGLAIGTSSMSLYAIIERFFGVKIENDNDSEEGKIIQEAVNSISADKKFDLNDADDIQNALDKLKNI